MTEEKKDLANTESVQAASVCGYYCMLPDLTLILQSPVKDVVWPLYECLGPALHLTFAVYTFSVLKIKIQQNTFFFRNVQEVSTYYLDLYRFFFSWIQIFRVIHTNFILDHNGGSQLAPMLLVLVWLQFPTQLKHLLTTYFNWIWLLKRTNQNACSWCREIDDLYYQIF